MSERDDYEALFLAHLPFIQQAAASVARRLGLRDADASEFDAWVTERLWEGEYAILRKWRGESRLTTYLVTVVAFFGREYRVKYWGRWRPPAVAVHLGPVAVKLATYVYRDGMSLAEAVQQLRARDETNLSDRELGEMFAKIPANPTKRVVDEQAVPIETLVDDASATDGRVLDDEADRERTFVRRALDEAVGSLTPREQVIIRMHYLQGTTFADISRAIGGDQKKLYYEKNAALRALRQRLIAAGITAAQVAGLLGGAFSNVSPITNDTLAPRDSAGSRPSNDSCHATTTTDVAGSSVAAAVRRAEP